MNKFLKLAAAGLMAASLAACSSSTTSTSTSTSAEEETTEETAAAEEEVVTEGTYTVTNSTGAEVTELYFYQTGTDDKGENYAAEGLADGDQVVVEISVDEETAANDFELTVEYVDADGNDVVVFESLHLEEASMYLKSADDVTSGATPFSAAE